jgi:hypothetical protein
MSEKQTTNNCINLGSYNYLGFAENSGPCTDQAIEACKRFGLSSSSTRHEVRDLTNDVTYKREGVSTGKQLSVTEKCTNSSGAFFPGTVKRCW